MQQGSEGLVRWAARAWAAGDADIVAVYAEEWTSVVDSAPSWCRLGIALPFTVGALAHAGRARLAWRRAAAEPHAGGSVDTVAFKFAVPPRRALVVYVLGFVGKALVCTGRVTRIRLLRAAGTRALMAGFVVGSGPDFEARMKAFLFVVAIVAYEERRQLSSDLSIVRLGPVVAG